MGIRLHRNDRKMGGSEMTAEWSTIVAPERRRTTACKQYIFRRIVYVPQGGKSTSFLIMDRNGKA